MRDFTDETHITLAELQDPGAIERVEESGTVRYTNILLLAPGIWGDAGSGRHILYSPEGIENSADNWEDDTVNLFHERENEVTDVGRVDTESVYLGEDTGGLYADVVLHMDNPASEFADEALQNALETDGREGIQGPSVELRGEEYRFNESEGVHELVEGTFNGLGLVGLGVSPGPGSKDAAFAEQTRNRAVALAGTEHADVLTLQNNVTMNTDHVLEQLRERGISVGDDPDEDTLTTLAEAFDLELQEEEEEEDEEEESEEQNEEETEEEEEEEDVEINLEEVATRVEEIGSTVAENSERIDAMAERFEDVDDSASLSDLFKTVSNVSETLETLAEAETVEELDQRLSDLEDTEEEATSLADVGAVDQSDDDEKFIVEMGENAPQKPAFGR